MGVITTSRLDEGTAFGPVPPTMTLADPIVLIGHRTCDTLPDIHTVKLDLLAFSVGSRLAEWVPYVQAAREAHEQNMEAIIDDGQLYFRVTRTVPANTELLIWYSDKLAARIGVPELRDDDAYIRGDRYCCSKCHESFMYPNCLRAHMRFRCKYRQQMVLGVADESNNWKRHSDEPTSAKLQFNMAPLCDPDRKLLAKRKRVDNVDTHSPPRLSGTGSTSQPEVESRLRATTPKNGVENTAVDTSAFQRVQLPPTGCPPSPPTSGPTLMTPSTPVTSGVNPAADGAGLFLFPGLVAAPRALPVGMQVPDRMPAGFPAAIAPNELHPVSSLNNNNNNESSSRNKMSDGVGGPGELATKMAMVQPDARMPLPFVYRAANPVIDKMLNLFGSAAAVAAAAAAGAAGTGGALTTSGFPSLNLAQNWCAKCNTSFRMTSDLVYHMRSHHKREFDPVKRRKDDKLRCDVCGESFRERHHLTRHMTSHS